MKRPFLLLLFTLSFWAVIGCGSKECSDGSTPDPAGNCPIPEDGDDDTQ